MLTLRFAGRIALLPEFYARGMSNTTWQRGGKQQWEPRLRGSPLPKHMPHWPMELRLQNTSSKIKLLKSFKVVTAEQ